MRSMFQAREDKGHSLKEMSRVTGIPWTSLRDYESKKIFPSGQRILKIEHHYGPIAWTEAGSVIVPLLKRMSPVELKRFGRLLKNQFPAQWICLTDE